MEKENQILMQLWTKRETSVFDIRTFHLAGISSRKAEEPLDQNKRSKNQTWVWGHCNLCTLSWLCLFCNLNRMKSPFPDVFNELLFPICFLVFTKICVIILLSNKYPPCWSFKLAESNQFKVDIKSRTGLT